MVSTQLSTAKLTCASALPSSSLYSSPTPSTSSLLLSLPPELLFYIIVPQLAYPDALSLKHTSPHFYTLIDTSVRLKVAWLIMRKARGLECPTGKKCVLKTDAAFCAGGGGEIRRIMERRRRHEECGRKGRGCEVVEGRGWCCVQSTERRRGRRRWVGGWERLWGLRGGKWAIGEEEGVGAGSEMFIGMVLGLAVLLVMWWRKV